MNSRRELAWRTRTQRAAGRARDDAAQASVEAAGQKLVLLEAWIGQRTEWTRSIFAMASAAIGLLAVALVNKEALALQPLTKCLMFMSCVAFCAAVVGCLQTFIESANALELAMNPNTTEQQRTDIEQELKRLESVQLHGFAFGLGLLVVGAFLEHALRP